MNRLATLGLAAAPLLARLSARAADAPTIADSAWLAGRWRATT